MATLLSLFRDCIDKVPLAREWVRRVRSDLTVETLTYGDLARMSGALSADLRAEGVRKGDRVLIFARNSHDVFLAFWAALRLGAIPCVLFPSLGEEGVIFRVNAVGGGYFLTDASMDKWQTALAACPDTRVIPLDETSFRGDADESEPMERMTETDPAFIIFTSGTTGTPKPIVHAHGMGESILRSMRHTLHAEESDVYWCTAHPAWITGTVYGILGPTLCALTSVQYDGNFHAKRWMPILQEQRVNLWYSAPTAFRSLMREDPAFFAGFDFSALRQIYSIGEPLPPSVFEWGRRTFRQPIYDTWFQTETGTIRIAAQPGAELLPGSMGCPVDDAEVWILDEANRPVPPGSIGRLCLKRGWESCFKGIYGMDTMPKKMKADYYESGDLVRADERGNLFFEGRADDIINTSGHLVSPTEIESVLLRDADILEAAVTSEPDPITWERPAAFLRLREGAEWSRPWMTRLNSAVHQSVAPYAVPKRYEILEELPKTPNGKIDRASLKNRLKESQ